MLARSGLVGKKSSWPYLGPSEAIFSIGRKNPKNAKILPIFLGGPMGPIHPVWALAAIHPRWGNRYFILGCVGRGLDLDLTVRPAPAASLVDAPGG